MIALLTVEQVAKELRISVSSVHHLTSQRQIGFVKLGRRIYISPQDIETYIVSKRVEPTSVGLG